MEKPILLIVFTFIITLICVLVIMGAEYWVSNEFLVPILEGIIIFLGVFFIYKTSRESYFFIVFLFAFFFILLETGVYILAIALNMVEMSYKEVLSWRLLYNSFFTFIYIPLLCYGIRLKEGALYVLFFLCGSIFHIIWNLIFSVIS